jgi:hypothetical protein
VSEIHVSPLIEDNGLYKLGQQLPTKRILNKAISHPQKTAVSVQIIPAYKSLKVLIAHSNGTFEGQDIFVG